MSKRIDANITCPNCSNQFPFTLFRSIWGEYPENRELVMTDKINVATCPSCKVSTKVSFPFLYTNAKQLFAVWWEPEYDPQIDNDSNAYTKMMGAGNYLATAPRVKDWNEFKKTIIQFEKGELQGKAAVYGKEMQGFLNDIKEQSKKKDNSGCLGIIVFLMIITGTIAYGISIAIF